MKARVITFLAVVIVTSAMAEDRVVTDFHCLSGGPNNSIHLEWRTFTDIPTKWTASYVKYKGSSAPISLVRRSEEATQKPKGRPWEFTSVWQEVVGGKITGEYEIVSQGANVYSFTYRDYRSGRRVDFDQDIGAFGDDECEWQ